MGMAGATTAGGALVSFYGSAQQAASEREAAIQNQQYKELQAREVEYKAQSDTTKVKEAETEVTGAQVAAAGENTGGLTNSTLSELNTTHVRAARQIYEINRASSFRISQIRAQGMMDKQQAFDHADAVNIQGWANLLKTAGSTVDNYEQNKPSTTQSYLGGGGGGGGDASGGF